jgi:hypothetical protein
MEAFAALVPLRTPEFADEATNSVVTCFTDNLPFYQAFYKYNNDLQSDSPGLTVALRAIAFMLVKLNCTLHLLFVTTDKNLADPPSRDNPQDFADRLGSHHLSLQFSEVSPPSLKIQHC